MPKGAKPAVLVKRVEAIERNDFIIIYTEFGFQFLRCVLSTGRTKTDKLFEIWVPNEDHSTFSNQSSPIDAKLVDSDYDVVNSLWEGGWCLLIPPKLFTMNNYLLKGTFKDSVINYVLNNNKHMGTVFFEIDGVAKGILFQSCRFNHRKSSSSNLRQLNHINYSQSMNTKIADQKDKIPFRQLPDFDSSDDDDDDDNGDDDDGDDDDGDDDDVDFESRDYERYSRSKSKIVKKASNQKAKKRPVGKLVVARKARKSTPAPNPFRVENYVPLSSPARNMEPSAMRKTVKSNNRKIFGTADIAGLIKEGLDTAASSTSNYIKRVRK